MPSWPTQIDYKEALQNPELAFRHPVLRASRAEQSPMGVPRARSGAFASVYKMSRGADAVALKLFNFPNEDRASRYQAVSDYLKKLGPKKPRAMVGFEYHAEGIRVGSDWFPTLTMEWVKGKTLGEWVREAVDRKAPDAAAIKAMADSWCQLVVSIQAAGIAHGDLQHDNVMVVSDGLALVDYDGMCVPDLVPADPAKRLDQLEFGKPAYQHPGRPKEKLGLHLDQFASWIILIALRAIAADPSLYVRFVMKNNNEDLLFTPSDIVFPASSALWPELFKSQDADVKRWSRAIHESLNRPFSQIPAFSLDPFENLRKLVSAAPRDWTGIAAETNRLAKAGETLPPELAAVSVPAEWLRELCTAAHKDYAAIANAADIVLRSGKPIPGEIKPAVDEARRRISCRDTVQAALDSRNPRSVKVAYRRPMLEGWADTSLLASAEAALAQVDVLDKLRSAVHAPGDGRALVHIWTTDGSRVAGIAEAVEYGKRAEEWAKKVAAAEEFVKLCEKPGATERDLAFAWKKVVAAGIHPGLIRTEHRMRGEKALTWKPGARQVSPHPQTKAASPSHKPQEISSQPPAHSPAIAPSPPVAAPAATRSAGAAMPAQPPKPASAPVVHAPLPPPRVPLPSPVNVPSPAAPKPVSSPSAGTPEASPLSPATVPALVPPPPSRAPSPVASSPPPAPPPPPLPWRVPSPSPPTSVISAPNSSPAIAQPLPAGFIGSRGTSFSPPAIFLSLTLLCTFFPWVGTFIGGSLVDAQGPWGAIFGAETTRNFELEKLSPVGIGWLDRVTSDWQLMLPCLLALIAATVLAWGDHWPRFNIPKRKLLRTRIIVLLAPISLSFMIAQTFIGFGLQRAVQEVVAGQFAAETDAAAGSRAKLAEVQHKEEQELARYNLSRTAWLYLAILCNTLSVASIMWRLITDRKGARPLPRLVLQY